MRSSTNTHHFNGDSNTKNGGGASSSSTNNRVLTKGKVVIIGEYSVGKTSLVQRYITKNRPTRTEPTIGAAFQVATVQDVVYKPTNLIVTQSPVLVSSSSSSSTGNNASSSTFGGGNGGGGGSSLNAPGNRHSRRLSNVGIGSGGVPLDLATSGGAAPPRTMTIGSGPTAIHIPAAPQTVTLEVWDTAGSERYRALMPLYFRDAAVAVVCFDLGNVASFDRVGMWLAELRKHNAMAGHDDPALEADEESGYNRSSMRHSGGDVANGRMVGIVKMLCGTKADLRGSNREVSSDEAIALAEAEGMIYFETSAKVGMNVSTMFQSIAQAVYSLKVDHLHADVKRESGGGGDGGPEGEFSSTTAGGSSTGKGTGLFGRKGGAASRKVDLTKEGNTNRSTPKGVGPKKRCSC